MLGFGSKIRWFGHQLREGGRLVVEIPLFTTGWTPSKRWLALGFQPSTVVHKNWDHHPKGGCFFGDFFHFQGISCWQQPPQPAPCFLLTWNELKSPANARSPRLFDTVALVIFRSGGFFMLQVTGPTNHLDVF